MSEAQDLKVIAIYLQELVANVVDEIRMERRLAREGWDNRECTEHCGL